MTKVWLVYNSHFGNKSTGTAIRHVRLTELARNKGCEVILVGNSYKGTPPAGIRFQSLAAFEPASIGIDDYVLVSGYLPSRTAWRLVRSKAGFDVDFSCITAPEVLESRKYRSDRQDSTDRKRRRIRYSVLCRRADRVILSNEAQLSFLSGVLYSRSGRVWADLASELTTKVKYLPMGVGNGVASIGENPYPTFLADRKIFLWGGGIWPWMDYRRVIDSFCRDVDPGPRDPALFFLVGRNSSTIPWLDHAVRDAREYAAAKGCLGRTVFFNDREVAIDEAPAYVLHCFAGILGNGDCLESRMSWRTRLLDLMAFGKPALILGRDPLGTLMSERGAALTDGVDPSMEPWRLVADMVGDADRYQDLCERSKRLGGEMTWEVVFREWPFHPIHGQKSSISWCEALRYVLAV